MDLGHEPTDTKRTDENSGTQTIISLEETKVLEKLALRLELNGIQVDDSTTVPTGDLGHDRVHPTRRHLIRTETPVNNLLALPEIKERLKGVQHSDWSVLEVASVDSELGTSTQIDKREVKDMKPIIYGKIKGVMAKIYIAHRSRGSNICNI